MPALALLVGNAARLCLQDLSQSGLPACRGLFFVRPILAQPVGNPSGGGLSGLLLLLVLLAVLYVAGICAIALFFWLKTRIKKWVKSWKD